METNNRLHCRVIACREELNDGKEWSYYFINDSETIIELVMLTSLYYEWGDWGNSESADVKVNDLKPGDAALLWRDDGSGAEVRMTLTLRIQKDAHDVQFDVEFPKLYLKKDLPLVPGLGKNGWEEKRQPILG